MFVVELLSMIWLMMSANIVRVCVLSSLESVIKTLAVAEVVQRLRLISVLHLVHSAIRPYK